MTTFNEIIEALFGKSNSGGKFLLCLATYVLLFMLGDYFESKMSKIAIEQDPKMYRNNPFASYNLEKAEFWSDTEWRKLKIKRSLVEYLLVVPLLFGMWFGLESVIIILGNIFNW